MVRQAHAASVLDSPIRQRIYLAVRASPGIPMRELARALSMPWSLLHYHVGIMERAGTLTSTPVGKRRLLSLPGSSVPTDLEAAALLREPTAHLLAVHIAQASSRDIGTLIEATGVSPRVAYHHVKRFVEHGLVATDSPSRYERIEATPKLYDLLGQSH